jgi:hypothetical protein
MKIVNGKNILLDICIAVRIILKWILREWGTSISAAFSGSRQSPVAVLVNAVIISFTKGRKNFYQLRDRKYLKDSDAPNNCDLLLCLLFWMDWEGDTQKVAEEITHF